MQFFRRWWPVLFLAAIPLLPLWRCVFLGDAIGPFDQIRQMAPWNGPKPEQPWDVLQADGVLQTYVWRDLVFDAWSKGQLPLWNPYQLAGTPLLANSQSAGFYPPHVLMGLLRVPTATAITFLAWLHLFWAGWGVFALARRLGASEVGAVIGGASFALSPFMVSWTALASVITTVAWIPWVLVGVLQVARPTIGAGFLRSAALMGLAAALMLYGGHLQFAAYGIGAALLLALGYVLFGNSGFVDTTDKTNTTHRSHSSYPIRSRLVCLASAVISLVLGAMLAAPQLLPVLEHSKNAHRRGVPTEEGYKAYVGLALKPYELGIIGSAQALGNPREPMKVGEVEVSAFWPALVKQGANFAESAMTLGPLVLGLLFLVPWKRRELWPFAALGLLALLLAMGTDLNRLLYFGVPGWSATGSPNRIGVLFVLCGCVLAAMGVDQARELATKPLAARLFGGVVVGTLLVVLGPRLAPALQGMDTQYSSLTLSAAIVVSLAAITLGAVLAYTFLNKSAWRFGILAVPLVLNIVENSHHLMMSGRPIETLRRASSRARVAIVNDPWSLHVAAPALMPPNTAALSRIPELGGYDSLIDRNAKELVDGAVGGDSAPPANGNIAFVKPTFDPAKLAEAGVTEVWSRVPLPQLGEPHETREGYAVWRLDGPGRVTLTGGSAEIVEDGYDRQVVRVSGPGKLIVRDRRTDGWKAREGDAERPLGPSPWREVGVTRSGPGEVEFRYDPPGLGDGLRIGGIAALLAALVFVFGTARLARASDSEGTSPKPVVQ